jgi:hypothetical protein
MLRPAVIKTETTLPGSGEMRDDIEWRIGERPTEMPGLRIITEQHQRHTCQVADIFKLFALGRQF